jgi:membrane-bound lytic murein transglycosylase D
MQTFKKPLFILGILVMIALCYRLFIYHYLTSGNKSDTDASKYSLYQFSLPKDLHFAGEQIPLDDPAVRDRMVRLLIYNTYDKTQTLLLHKLSARWFPMIERMLKKHGIPDDFKYLVLVESRFGNEISYKGASGFWQFIPATALQYGLEISSQVDERNDPEKATEAACRYITDCRKRFDNWTLTAASYNMGPEALLKQMQLQDEKNYYDLLLNRETSVYIFKVLAMKEIITKPTLYGYRFKRKQLYAPVPYITVTIDSSVTSLAAFAKSCKTTLPLLKFMNPWLTGDKLMNAGRKKYSFKIIKHGFESVAGIINMADSVTTPDTNRIHTDSIMQKAVTGFLLTSQVIF